MAWIELIIGIVALCVGILFMLGAANTPAPDAQTNKTAIYGLIIAIIGAVLTTMGIVHLVAKVIHMVAG